jgi:hypothetical protein
MDAAADPAAPDGIDRTSCVAERRSGTVESLYGQISIDVGFTLRSLFGYLTLISLAFITTVLTRNRERAETILFVLCAITTFIAVELILFRDQTVLKPAYTPSDSASSLVALAAFGTILNIAFVVRSAERYETRAQREAQSLRAYVGMMLLGTLGAVICLIALVSSTTSDVLIAAGFGLVVVGLVILIRRLSLGRWTAVIVCAAVLVACGGVVALRFSANPAVNPLFRFATTELADSGAATLRMVSDANWTGGGVWNLPGACCNLSRCSRRTRSNCHQHHNLNGAGMGPRRAAHRDVFAHPAVGRTFSRRTDARQRFLLCSKCGGMPCHGFL